MEELQTLANRHRRLKLAGLVLFAVLALGAVGSIVYFTRVPKTPVVTENLPTPTYNPYTDAHVEAQSAIVFDLKTKETLYDQHAEDQLPLASLTKLLTIFAAVDILPAGALVPITPESLTPEGDNGFTVGDSFAFEDIAKLALVASSNDAASAIGEAAAGRRTENAQTLLAGAAAAAGLTQTYAFNDTGLDETESTSGAYGSAKDIALLAGALLQKAPSLAEATTRETVSATSAGGNAFTLKNTNQGVGSVAGLLFSKTGFTDLAGGNLVVVVDVGIDHPIAIVVLGSSKEGRFSDVEKLLSATRAHFALARL